MDRRAFLGALGLLAAPLPAEAQPVGKVWRIGYLGYGYATEARDLEAFRQRLRDLGYVEGKNVVIESRLAESSFERLPALAAELVNLKVDVIAAYGNPTIIALMRTTQTIPIVMIVGGWQLFTEAGIVQWCGHDQHKECFGICWTRARRGRGRAAQCPGDGTGNPSLRASGARSLARPHRSRGASAPPGERRDLGERLRLQLRRHRGSAPMAPV